MNRQNGRQAWRRALSVILSIAMAVGSVPATVLAEENATEPQEVATNGTDELDLVNEDAAAPEESFEDAVEDVVEMWPKTSRATRFSWMIRTTRL